MTFNCYCHYLSKSLSKNALSNHFSIFVTGILLIENCSMIKRLFFFFISLLTTVASAQNGDLTKYLLTNKANTFGISTLGFLDPYLSPLTYSGLGVNYEYQTCRFLSVKRTNISIQTKFNIETGIALNPRITSDLLYVGANYGWGLQYHFAPFHGFRFLAGGLWDFDFGLKNVERNINNPVNLDISTNLNLTAVAKYDVLLKHKTLKLQLALQSPILGYMFVPRAGASYFEMFELGNLTDVFHFSSLFNKWGLNSVFSVDVPFNHSVWRFGIKAFDMRHEANNMVFNRNEFSFLIGTTFDSFNFSGRKNKAPVNFISPNE